MSNSKRRDFEDSKTHWLFENWPILADFLTKSFRKKIFRANFKHKPCENCKLEIYPKFGPKIQFYGPEWCFLVHTNPIDEKNRQKFFSLNKGAILLQHLPSRSDTHQALSHQNLSYIEILLYKYSNIFGTCLIKNEEEVRFKIYQRICRISRQNVFYMRILL